MSGDYSREALRARLGDAAFEDAAQQAAQAPEASPELVERLRRIFAPTVRRLSRPAEHDSAA